MVKNDKIKKINLTEEINAFDFVNIIETNRQEVSESIPEVLENISKTKCEKPQTFINDVTLQYMMNREHYAKYMDKQLGTITKMNNKDKRFYRKRIYNLTKILLLNNKEKDEYFKQNSELDFDLNNISSDVLLSFETFLKNCIQNFKLIDTCDILQEEFQDYSEQNYSTSCLDEYDESSTKNLFVKSTNKKKYTLDNFVKINENAIVNEMVLPIQKEINLTDTTLKRKGIHKKNDICKKDNKSNYNEKTTEGK